MLLRDIVNILLLSTIYPLPTNDNKGTAVCHFFTREWVKNGYTVRTVHVQAVYPLFLYWIAKFHARRIAAKTGAVVYTERLEAIEHYVMDNVPVMRIPVFKPIPHGKFSLHSIKNAIASIVADCLENDFKPDVIIGHFPNPQIEMLSLLKREFPLAKTCIVMHGDVGITQKVYGKRLSSLMRDIDMWGFRSKSVLREFESVIGDVDKKFICHSGIPEAYIKTVNERSFPHALQNFVYVGLMIDRKYPEKVLEALEIAYPTKNFHLNYIGDGQRIKDISIEIDKMGLHHQVSLLGRIPREKILEEYDKADCMVMISEGEAYGLVYLEAMARGCITVASRNEGFDGVIVDGENGFLCEAGNAQELASIIKRINTLTPEKRQLVSENAINTAKRLTDENAARLYIENVKARM